MTGVSMMAIADWHTLRIDELLVKLRSTSGGLTVAEAAGRLEVYGQNRIQAERRASPW